MCNYPKKINKHKDQLEQCIMTICRPKHQTSDILKMDTPWTRNHAIFNLLSKADFFSSTANTKLNVISTCDLLLRVDKKKDDDS